MDPVRPSHAFDQREEPNMFDNGIRPLPSGSGSQAQRTTNAGAIGDWLRSWTPVPVPICGLLPCG